MNRVYQAKVVSKSIISLEKTLNLQNLMCLLIVLVSIVLTILDIVPKYGKVIIMPFFGIAGICSL